MQRLPRLSRFLALRTRGLQERGSLPTQNLAAPGGSRAAPLQAASTVRILVGSLRASAPSAEVTQVLGLPRRCPPQVDGALLAHPAVAEAVSFAAPDEKYGEVVAAAVVLTEEGKKQGDGVGEWQF